MISYKREVKRMFPDAYCKLGDVTDKLGVRHYVYFVYLNKEDTEAFIFSFTVYRAWQFAYEDIVNGKDHWKKDL